jgi:RHS repeat-associated protein
VTEPAGVASDVYLSYRAQNDDSYARYERMKAAAPYRWRVRTSDGKVLTFGESARMPNCAVSDQHAPLTGMVDAFGNEVRYDYVVGMPDECVISKITWGQNAGANLPAFASVVFTYKPNRSCNGVYTNSQTDYRTGTRIVTGALTLQMLTITAYPPGNPNAPVHTRHVELGYDPQSEQCNRPHAPVRLLTSIKESAWGTDSPQVTLPPVTFEYNAPGVTLMTPQGGGYETAPWAIVDPRLQNLGWGYRREDNDRWPTVESMFLDVDGDGLQDLVTNGNGETASISECEAVWHRNEGADPDKPGKIRFAWNFGTIELPRLKWHGGTLTAGGSSTAERDYPSKEGCALNGQVTAYRNAYDLPNVCHHEAGKSCVAGSDPWDDSRYCYPGGTLCPTDPGGPPAGKDFRTYLAYRWLDMDGDGLTDLVAAVQGDIDSYDIERGNVPGFTDGEPSIWGIPGINQWPSCPRDQDKCKSLETCFDGVFARTCDKSGCHYDWTKILQCVSKSTGSGCAHVLMKPASGPDGAPGVGVQRYPYERCEGLHPWFIYWNQGAGQFATTPTIKYQPVPLESSSGDSSLGGGLGMTSENHAIIDFDGDGMLDAVVRATKQLQASWTSGAAWQVWLGDGTGGFSPRRIPFPTRTMLCPSIVGPCPWGANAISATGGAWGGNTLSMAGLLDVNGDGALDHWLAHPDTGNADIGFNDGEQIRLNNAGASEAMGDVTTPTSLPSYAVKPGNDTHVTPTNPTYPVNPHVHIKEGTTTARNRVVDVDNDGRPDVVTFADPTAVPMVHFNVGEQFIAPGIAYGTGAPAGVSYDGLRRQTEAKQNVTLHETEAWKLNSDLVDLDGDGIPEGLFFTDLAGFRRATPQRTQPPRLLRAVHNGRGAHSTITYAQMHDEDAVTQSPRDLWPDGRPKASPRAQWVVKSIEGRDDLAGTTGTTKYNYRNPRFGADPDGGGRYSFRGFEEVTTTKPSPAGNPSGARSVQRYAYDVDASGRLVETIVMPSVSEGANDARSIDRTSWQMLSLFNGAVRTYHPTVSEHYVCTNGQNEAACRATPAGKTVTTSAWSAYPLSGNQELWVESSSLVQASGERDRRTLMTYYLKSGSEQFILRPQDTSEQELANGVWTTYGQTRQTWSTTGAQETDEVWVDGDDRHRAITRYDVDKLTGNRTSVWKPVQWAENPNTLTNLKRAVSKYDERKLFVQYDINELGHTLAYKYEYGTGTKLETRGPNVPPCVASNNCAAGAQTEQIERIRVDGMARILERYSTFAEPGAGFTQYKVETNTYFDGVGSYVTHENVIVPMGGMAPRYAKDKTDLDGHGRPIRKTMFANGAAPVDGVTTYTYAADGTMTQVRLPDPSKNDASTVAYTYGYDSLGRPRTLRRADAASTGVDLTYDGLVQTSKEIVGTAGGKQAATRTTKNSIGRLVRVEEQVDASTWALTQYLYDADGNIHQTIDPEGVTTTLDHDMAGRRTRIERAGRAWNYTYDANGNMRTETSPCTGIGCAALYTTSTAYDVLDRPISKAIAPRNLTSDERLAFASGTEKFTWDEGFNAKGRLSRWQAFAPGASQPTNDISRTWNLQGQRSRLQESFYGAGYGPLTRTTATSHLVSGAVDTVWYGDAVPGDSCPGLVSYAEYDARGLPSGIWINNCSDSSGFIVAVSNERNVAGLVTKRYSNWSPTYVESNWSYDALGRVTGQSINKGSSLTQVARQDLTYNGNDDPRTLDHWLGTTNHKRFTFDYDQRHQLTSVAEDANAFAATYAYSDAGRFVSAKETAAPLPGSDVKPRDVEYRYAGRDPEQVTALISASGPYAQYTYDDAGSQVTRTYVGTGETWQLTYDGENQLRRAVKKQFGVTVASEDYYYDDAGARQIIVKRDAFGAKTEMRWFIGDTEAHYNDTGTIKRVYSYVSMGTPVARVERSNTGSASLEYQFHGLGNNTLAAVDQSTGAVNASFVYAPFGEIIEATEGGASVGLSAHRRRMNDKYVDEATGLGHYGFRYYDNVSMTWTQSDPLYRFAPDAAWTKPRQASLYTFCLNNSLRYLDPDGRQTAADAMDIGKVAGGAASSATGIEAGATLLGAGAATAGAAVIVTVGALVVGYKLAEANPDLNIGADAYTRDEEFSAHQDFETAQAQERSQNQATYQATLDAFTQGVADGRQTLDKSGGVAGTPRPMEAKQTGSYTNTHASGKTYSGKGSTERSQQSGRRVERATGDPHVATDWTPANSTREAFKKESERIDASGGVNSNSNYNQLESPGKRYRQEDGEIP